MSFYLQPNGDVVLVHSCTPEMSLYSICEGSQMRGEKEITGVDLYVSAHIVSMRGPIDLSTKVYVLSLPAFHSYPSWPVSVRCLIKGMYPVDDGDDFILASRAIRRAISAGMKPKGPGLGTRLLQVIVTKKGFEAVTKSLEVNRSTRSRSYGCLEFNLSAPGLPSRGEFTTVQVAKSVTSRAAYDLVEVAKKVSAPLVLYRGEIHKAKGKVKEIQGSLNPLVAEQAPNCSIPRSVRQREAISSLELTFLEIQELERVMGPFMEKTPRGSEKPLYFIEKRRAHDDPEVVPETPTFKLKFSEATSQLSINFSYVTRNASGLSQYLS